MFHRVVVPFRLTLSIVLATGLGGLLAQAAPQNLDLENLPRIEGTYQQVLTSDSMGLGQAALSPDGRWIVFGGFTESEESRLWIVSADGGEPWPITQGNSYDDGPVWFPGSDRIAYRAGHHIESLAIDPSTGRPAGEPQRVTLEPSIAYFDISPDGRWIAYTPMGEKGNRVIRVVPSNGGIARTVAESSTTRPAWAPDGRSLYYETGRMDSPECALMSVRVEAGARAEGAEPEEVFTHVGRINTATYPSTAFAFLEGVGSTEKPKLVITTLEGEALGVLELEEGMRARAVSSDGRRVLVERHGSAAPLRVAPVAGGSPRTLQRADSRALGWTADGEQVLVEIALNGTERLFLASIAGRGMTELRLPEQPADSPAADMHFPLGNHPDPVLSADGRHLLFAVPGTTPDTATLKILDLETGVSTPLTTSYPLPRWDMTGRVLGPGGTVNRDGDEFFYWEKEGDALVLMAARPTGESRRLRAFSAAEQSVAVAVHGNRIVYLSREGTEASLLLAEVGRGEPRTILTVEGFLDVLAWSPDGRWLAATHWPADGEESDGARPVLIRVAMDGTVEGGPRFLGPGAWSWWGHQWLPDSSGFLTAGTEGDVWFIPTDPMAEPVSLTKEENGEIETFVLSPDGEHIAYAPWIPEGQSLWLFQLERALSGGLP